MQRTRSRAALLIAALAVIAIVQAVAAYLVSRQVGESAVAREAEVAQEFLNSILRGHKLETRLFAEPAALADFTGSIGALPDLIRANVYSPDGIIRYSSQEGLAGVRFEEHNEELEEAFAGRLVAELATVSRDSKAEHLALPLKPGEAFVEAYVPVSNQDGKTLAVVELYKRPAGLADNVASLRSFIWRAAGLAGLALFGAAAMLIYRRGS
jgi:two-component system sensor histidine kinase HydH